MSGPLMYDRVAETTTTTGTGTVTLAGAKTGYQSFAAVGNSNTCYYTIAGGSEWEVGIGTYTSSGTTLSRDTILASSNSGSAVTFSAGTKDVFCDAPAVAIPWVQTVVASGSPATLGVSSIPAGYNNLRITLIGRDTTSGTSDSNVFLKLNADGTSGNYDAATRIISTSGVNSGATPASSSSGGVIAALPNNGATANAVGTARIEILNYADTSLFKTPTSSTYSRVGTSPTSQIYIAGFTWKSTAAVNAVLFTANTAFVNGSKIVVAASML